MVGPGGATIGRSRECDIVLGDSNVSRQHARICARWATAGRSRTSGSTNGVLVNGAPAAERPQALRAGDRLDIGTVYARFEVE